MIVTGILLKANEARIVTLSGSKNEHIRISLKPDKLTLPENPTQSDVEVFCQTFKSYCEDNAVNKVIINRRATSGKYPGGAGTFIIEGIILTISPVPVEFVSPNTVKATDKRESELKIRKPTTVDLGLAYDLAFEGLN
jgi:hypothetical protein